MKRSNGWYKYIDDNGLQDATAEQLLVARKEYLNTLKRKSRKEKAANEHPFTIWLTNDELKTIAAKAKQHDLSRTRFLKLASLAYTQQKFLLVNHAAVVEISELLRNYHAQLLTLFESDKLPEMIGEILLATMEHLETTVMVELTKPKIVTN